MSTFNRWRKVELLDLAEKLKIPHVPNHVRKNDLIQTIENHLNILNEPLDVEIDYPELKSFYDSIVIKHEEEDEAEAEAAEGEQEQEQEQEQEEESMPTKILDGVDDSNFNNLDFSDDPGNDEDSTFKFGFENYLSDIVVHVRKFNESVQDSLSTIQSIDLIFYLIEFYFIIKPLVLQQDGQLSITTLVAWVTCSFLLPVTIAYYINFIRYDLAMEIDPMVFHLSKFLISLTILNLNLVSTESKVGNFVKLGLTSWKHYLGQLPLIFAIVGTILTLYIF